MAKAVWRNHVAGFEMLDITAPSTNVEVELRSDGKVLWVNLEGRCVLRVCQIEGEVVGRLIKDLKRE